MTIWVKPCQLSLFIAKIEVPGYAVCNSRMDCLEPVLADFTIIFCKIKLTRIVLQYTESFVKDPLARGFKNIKQVNKQRLC